MASPQTVTAISSPGRALSLVAGGAALLALLASAGPAPARAGELEPAPEGLDPGAIARRADDSLRSDRTFFEATLTPDAAKPSRSRALRFQAFGDRHRRRTFIRVLEPSRERGTRFLLLRPNAWLYVPRDERLIRIERSELAQPWLDSEFSLDDLLRYSSEVEDYDHRLLGVDPTPEGFTGVRAYVVEHIPHPDVPVPWASIVSWIETEHATPLRREYRDADGGPVRVMRYGDIREVQGRRFPHVWKLRGPGRKARESRISVDTIRFDADFEESVFTTTNLTSAN